MAQTITITTKSFEEELNKWNLTNHGPIHEMALDVDSDTLDKYGFESALKMSSRKISEPETEKKETSV